MKDSKQNEFDASHGDAGPVTLADLAQAGLAMTVHCRKCGHWSQVNPAQTGIRQTSAIPDLDGRFRCSVCGSRDSCAMPLYPRKGPDEFA